MKQIITFFGQRAKVACDKKCNKAWGINSRPKVQIEPNNEDDYYFLSDRELPLAPTDPGTYEGGHAKPMFPEKFNKWCIRECERCTISEPGKYNEPVELPDFSKRIYNIKR